MLTPSLQDYDFRAADVGPGTSLPTLRQIAPNLNYADKAGAMLKPEEAGDIIASAKASPEMIPANSNAGIAVLLAAIYKSQKKNNCHFQPIPFNLGIWQQQQILTQNPLREYLLIQNVGSGDILVVFEESNSTVTDFSAVADQQALVIKQTRAIRIIAGGSYEPLTAPRNAITLFTLNTATNGVVLEGA